MFSVRCRECLICMLDTCFDGDGVSEDDIFTEEGVVECFVSPKRKKMFKKEIIYFGYYMVFVC